jgi:hypothetical protein
MDYELWLRLLDHGAQFKSVDELYGLFRWHQDQKSQAQFEKIGIPEIARLHTSHFGYAPDFYGQVSPDWEEYYFGVRRQTHRRAAGLFDQVWGLETHVKRMVLGRAPMDHWVFLNHKA